MKKYLRICAAILAAAAVLTLFGCSGNKNHELNVPTTEGSPISPKRTGAKRQGIYAHENGFECTAAGLYFMCPDPSGGNYWLLYSDHGSDTVIKLCGRPDCGHNDSDCNAYFSSASNICYYGGYLYTFGRTTSHSSSPRGVIRMNTDGSERLLVYDVSAFMAENGYKGFAHSHICNGIFFIGLKKTDENGNTVVDTYFYKLDGSMARLERTEWSSDIRPDGDAIVGLIGYDADDKQYIYGIFDSTDGSIGELFREPKLKLFYAGYMGSEALYYIENGVVYEHSYTDGVRILFDTGLRGNGYRLCCFPDIVVVHETLSNEEILAHKELETVTLRFYDWNFKDIGSVGINFDFYKILPTLICGETHERIMLTDYFDCVPRYYIDKSDLGTGNIKIHKYKLPDFE